MIKKVLFSMIAILVAYIIIKIVFWLFVITFKIVTSLFFILFLLIIAVPVYFLLNRFFLK